MHLFHINFQVDWSKNTKIISFIDLIFAILKLFYHIFNLFPHLGNWVTEAKYDKFPYVTLDTEITFDLEIDKK